MKSTAIILFISKLTSLVPAFSSPMDCLVNSSFTGLVKIEFEVGQLVLALDAPLDFILVNSEHPRRVLRVHHFSGIVVNSTIELLRPGHFSIAPAEHIVAAGTRRDHWVDKWLLKSLNRGHERLICWLIALMLSIVTLVFVWCRSLIDFTFKEATRCSVQVAPSDRAWMGNLIT